MAKYGIKIFAGNSVPELARDICNRLEIGLGNALVGAFSDGEIRVEIGDNVRGQDVYIVQSGAHPVNRNLVELLVMIDACKRASARRITAVMPYFSYGRQDRKNKPRVPITAKLAADLITTAGASRVLTMDLHAGQIQGFFDIPVDNLYGSYVLLPYIRDNFLNNAVIVSPDAGGVPRARAYARRLQAGLALIDKRRSDVNEAEALNIIGEVAGKKAIILDDMIDTAGTVIEATRTLLEKGAQEVYACASHPVLSGRAAALIPRSDISKLVVTNSLPLRPWAQECPKIHVEDISILFAKAIRCIHEEEAISELFELQQ